MNNKEGNLFVKNIDTSVTPKEFEEFFRNNANA
jgi:RNA recognition motif-containing protein